MTAQVEFAHAGGLHLFLAGLVDRSPDAEVMSHAFAPDARATVRFPEALEVVVVSLVRESGGRERLQ